MTPAEARAFISDKLAPKIRRGLDAGDFNTAYQALTDAEKAQIISAAIAGEDDVVGKRIQRMLTKRARALADARANEIVSNGSLDLAEFSEVFDA